MWFLLNYENIYKKLPVIAFELFNKESSFLINTNFISMQLTVLKNHFLYQLKILTCISGVDFLKNVFRFLLVYELLSINYNFRLRIKLMVDELTPVSSVEDTYSTATWWECEIWDMFGVFFINQCNLTRLLTDYGFEGFPLRKDFPLPGFLESRFNCPKHLVVYEIAKFKQEFRNEEKN